MPTNVPGNPAVYPANIVEPTDGDPRNAASVQTPFTNLADRTAYLKDKAGLLAQAQTWTANNLFSALLTAANFIASGASTFQAVMQLSVAGVLQDIKANNALATWESPNTPTDDRKLVGRLRNSANTWSRIYACKSALAFEVVTGAVWDQANTWWAYDDPGGLPKATRVLITSGGFFVHMYDGADHFADVSFGTKRLVIDSTGANFAQGMILGSNGSVFGPTKNCREAWMTVGVDVPFLNGWTDGGASHPVRFFRDAFNVVHVEGKLVPPGGVYGTDAFDFPVPYQPNSEQHLVCASNLAGTAFAEVRITNSGNGGHLRALSGDAAGFYLGHSFNGT